jgi:glycosyltransferase involved in cell wall biosynthesis
MPVNSEAQGRRPPGSKVMSKSVVSVVTPFRNVEPFLAQCIESVLAQTHENFEYILSDNGSSDGSTAIAERYAKRDARIRLIRQPQLLPQVAHYNAVLREIAPGSEYCKMVQADDFIFPECLEKMVVAFEQSPKIGLVSSYYLKGDTLRGSGYPMGATTMDGRQMAQFYLRTGVFVFGSPSVVMYRTAIVRQSRQFFEDGLMHEDTEKCLQILKDWDFGFAHQVLSYLRVGNESVSSAWRQYEPEVLDWYIIVQRYAPVFFDPGEAQRMQKRSRDTYYRSLRGQVLRRRGKQFWQYHNEGLKTLGESLDRPRIAIGALKNLVWTAANPGVLLARMGMAVRRRLYDSGKRTS